MKYHSALENTSALMYHYLPCHPVLPQGISYAPPEPFLGCLLVLCMALQLQYLEEIKIGLQANV